MDAQPSMSLGARRNEDIALDLLKFVSVTAGVGRPAAPSTGFSGAAGPKPEEHVNQLLSLYSRCLKAVEGHGPEQNQAGKDPEQVGKAPEQTMRAPQGWTEQR
ncbi:MAG: hypothetical protein ACLPXT_13105 [Terracidiphilus sp.]